MEMPIRGFATIDQVLALNDVPSYRCGKCRREFLRFYDKRRHEMSCGKQFKCKHCATTFDNSYNGKRHEEHCAESSSKKKIKTEPTRHQLLSEMGGECDMKEYETAFEGRLKSFFIRCETAKDMRTYLQEAKQRIVQAVKKELSIHKSLKINLLVECRFVNAIGETTDKTFKTRNQATFLTTDLNAMMEAKFKKLSTEMEESQLKGSNWALLAVEGVRLRINKFNPLRGSSYIPLPHAVEMKKACINPQNYKDEKCFIYATLAPFIKKDPQRISKYKDLENTYDFSCVSIPTPLADIAKFEKKNNISINVFGLDEKNEVFPLKVSDEELPDHRDLLLLSGDDGRYHYVFIKSFEKLVRCQKTKHKERVYICKRCFTHFDDRHGQSGAEKLREHREICRHHAIARIDMPTKDNSIVQFKNFERMLRLPYVIYADFESILSPYSSCSANPEASYSTPYQKHTPMSFCTYVKPSADVEHLETGLPLLPYVYRGSNAAEKFMEYLTSLAKKISDIYKAVKPMQLSVEQQRDFEFSTKCYLCGKSFTEENWKVRDHDHVSGEYRGSLHNQCNLSCKTPSYIPVFMHNLSGYDSHFIVKELGCTSERVEVIPSSEEKYIAFTKHVGDVKLRFVDTYRFLSASLDNLSRNLKSYPETGKYFGEEKMRLMSRKGVFPYDYITSWDALNDSCLPPKEAFYNKLNEEGITCEDYQHAKNVWAQCNIKNLGEYSDLYLTTDVLLLTDVFETFREQTLKTHKVDPAHYFTSPGLTWDAMLLYTGIKLDLLLDYEQLLMVEAGIRGGVCQVSHRYAQANNIYTEHYDPQEPSRFITYEDANNQYGWAMCHALPYGGFKWISPEDVDLESIKEDDPLGYILEVDIEYPVELHDLHNDLPFLPECVKPTETSSKKLIPHLGPRKKYVVHYLALKQAISHGLRVTKIHRALEFQQRCWLKPYVEYNNNLRKQAKNEFEKDLYKLFNNAMFGKTMENIRNRVDIRLVADAKILEKLIAKPTFIDRSIYGENLTAVHMASRKLIFNKPIYIGMSVLDISKTLMYTYQYDVLLPYYGVENLKLMYMDTDSFIHQVTTRDVYQDKLQFLEHMDTSDYPVNHICHSLKNKKVLGKFKDEACGKTIQRFVGLRPKMYAIDIDGRMIKKIKGIKRSAIKQYITFDSYVKCLKNNEIIRAPMNMFASHQHNVSSVKVNKIALSPHDDKRVIADDGISTYAYGHYNIVNSS